MKPWMFSVAFVIGCSGSSTQTVTTTGGGNNDDDADTTCPVIVHEPVDGAQPADVDVAIEAEVTDDGVGVFIVTVVYKQETSTQWEDAPLTKQAEGLYSGKIPGQDVGSGGMDYFLTAMDLEENECFGPAEGEDDPYHFRVSMQ